jgi:mannosyltransferase OCH1-like enzyme
MTVKTIHQIWFQGENHIPRHLKKYSETWKKFNPHYEYVFWDNIKIKTFIKKKLFKL